MKNNITIGIPSIVLIFMVLCLSVFSLLSISDARSALIFAKKHADTVQMYYEADSNAQILIRDYRNHYLKTKNPADALSIVSISLPDGGHAVLGESGFPIFEVPLNSEQTLHVELNSHGTEILSYYVYNNTDYDIDSELPVWGKN